MNPELSQTPREELELRLTALLLGELSADEAAAVREALAKDPELTKLHDDLKQTIRLVREATASAVDAASSTTAQPRISEARRKKLLTAFAIPPLKESDRKPKPLFQMRLIEVLAVVAIIVLLASMAIPNFVRSRTTSQANAVLNNLRQLDGAKQQWALEHNKSAGDVPTMSDVTPYLRGVPTPLLGETYVLGKVGDPVTAEVEISGAEKFAPSSWGQSLPLAARGERVRVSADGGSSVVALNDGWSGLPSTVTASAKPLVVGGSVAEHTWSENHPALSPREPSVVASSPAPAPAAPSPAVQIVLPPATDSSEGQSDSLDRSRAFMERYGRGRRIDSAADSPAGTLASREVTLNVTNSATVGDHPFVGFDRDGFAGEISRDGRATDYGVALGDTAHTITGDPEFAGVLEQPDNPHSATNTFAGRYAFVTTPAPKVGNDANLSYLPGPQQDSSIVPAAGLPSVEKSGLDRADGGLAVARRLYLPGVVASTTAPVANSGSFELSEARRLAEVGGDKAPVLGDLPVIGKLFKSEPNSTGRLVAGLPQYETNTSYRQLATLGTETLGRGERLRELASKDIPAKAEQKSASLNKSEVYFAKKRELEEMINFGRILNLKLSSEKIDLSLPKTSTVEIMDRATPAREKTGFWRSLGAPVGGSFASTARVKIERDVSDIQGLASSPTQGYDPYFVQTEFEVIQSEQVLGKVVDSLGLDQAWAKNGRKLNKAEAVAQLKARLDLKPVRNTSLVEVRATDADANEAAKIANAVAETYRVRRMQERARLTLGGIEALGDRYQEQQQKIASVQKELDRLRSELAISEAEAGGTAPISHVPAASAPAAELDAPVVRTPSTNAPIPQPEIQTSENAFSTFSLNVSDVSFKLAAASLEKGQMPDPGSVRSEEFINAFDYRDPEPPAGVPVAFAWERVRYPFAHNRDLLRFSLKTAAAGRQAGRPLNIVLLLDNSGSMERADRVSIIHEALLVLAAQLQSQDKLSVITFARTARLVADGISGDRAGEVAEQVSGLTPQGGTNLEEAMNLAYQTAAKHYLANGINRVVLLTDGAANLGNVEPESLKRKVEAQRKQGIALDCYGIGWEGFNDDLLEVLSRNGDGRYGFINSPEEAATEFAGQLAGALKVAASDVKVQVEFNPKRATAYRQIGYAKHQLTKEQFRDNTVDAAEIAAQEAGNALYTVEVNPAGEGPLCTVRVRYKIPGTTDYREQAWDVPYTGNALSLEQSSPAMRLAASASAFAEWLVASPFAGEVTPDRLLNQLAGVPEIYGADARPKKLEWMIRQAKSLEGK
jgi:Mg-chelatase subunit ChlD/type II secretory pathway pseudopilin PulG